MTTSLWARTGRAATRAAAILLATQSRAALPQARRIRCPRGTTARAGHRSSLSCKPPLWRAGRDSPRRNSAAVFDKDGTLWSGQPACSQKTFAIDELKRMAPRRPDWKRREPFASPLRGDLRKALAGGDKAAGEILMATHAGITKVQFEQRVRAGIARTSHPSSGRRHVDMVYRPVLELLAHLRACGFRTCIVSGGGIEFVRAWAETVYGIPPGQVVNGSMCTRFELRDGVPVPARLPEIDFVNHKGGKPVGIHRHIRRRTVAAVGNFDGDPQMLQWTAAGRAAGCAGCWATATPCASGPTTETPVSAGCATPWTRLTRGWTVVGMARDWATVFVVHGSERPPGRPGAS